MNAELTTRIDQLKEGGTRSQHEIRDAYFEDLVPLTRKRMIGVRKREFDEKDIAISAFHSFFKAAKEKRLSKLDHRADHWKLLMVIAARKVSTQRKRDSADKRGGGKVRGESIFMQVGEERAAGLEQALGRERSPEIAGELADTFARLMLHLSDETLRRVAILKLEGLSSSEIAKLLGCVERAVVRKVGRIRVAWLALQADCDDA